MKQPKIGVFDSGVGGLSVARAIEKALPFCEVIFVNDTKNVPYGTKTPDQLYSLVLLILNKLSKDVDVIVVACNTVSTTIIEQLRTALPIPLIAMEPMIKPAAAATKSKIIAVCATPTTLASDRYKWLKHTYAADIMVVEPDCSDWSAMIETNQLDRKAVSQRINQACDDGADVIVLGCTHYHWIEDIIQQVAGERAVVLQPEEPVIKQLGVVLERLG